MNAPSWISGGFLIFCSLVALPVVSKGLPFPNRDPWNKITAASPANGDQFGAAVAAHGQLLLVGAPGDGGDQGAAYLYDLETGVELQKITVATGEGGDDFGQAVALSETRILVGAPGFAGFGKVYLFDLATGELVHQFSAPDSNEGVEELFGGAVALSGDLAIVGARQHQGNGTNNSKRGSAYVFDAVTGDFLRKLEPSDPADGDEFGASVAISGKLALIGAPKKIGDGTDQGAAYLFDATDGTQLFKLLEPEPSAYLRFGTSVGISGNRIIVGGAAVYGVAFASHPGYIFNAATGTLIHRLAAPTTNASGWPGTSVAIGGGLAIVGDFFSDQPTDSEGRVLVFDLASGKLRETLLAFDRGRDDLLGFAVALSGRTVVAGAVSEDGTGTDLGAAYVFEIPHYQPDNRIGTAPFSGPGDNLYNTNASGQTISLTSRKLRGLKAWLTLQNDGDRADDYLLAATPGNRNFGVSYFRWVSNRKTNVTGALISGTHPESNLVPAEPGRLFCIEVTPGKHLKRKKKIRRRNQNGLRKRRPRKRVIYLRRTLGLSISSISQTFDFKRDVVRVDLQTR